MSLTVDIRKDFSDFSLRIRFETDRGTMGILGASGAGKSLTLRCIAGIERPDSGRIELDGIPLFDSERGINLPPQQRQVGYLFQNYALFPNMTVRQNILAGLHREINRKERERLLSELLERMQLSALQDRYPAELSGGQQQRTALARILASKPKLLLLDEPFSALDAHLRDQMLSKMRALLSDWNGKAILVTHSRNEAYTLSDTLAILDDGRIHAHKQTKALFADPETIAGARVTGCKNIAAARRTDGHTLFVPDWGISLRTALPICDNLAAVGIRAHHFSETEAENRYPVQIETVLEEPFEDTLSFRFAAQPKDTPALIWRCAKQTHPKETVLGIAAEDILVLRDE